MIYSEGDRMTLKVPLARPCIGAEEIERVKEVIESGWLTGGKYLAMFENEFRNYLGCRNAIGVETCTAGIMLLIRALEIKGEVIVPTLTYAATANAVINTGNKVVLADISEEDYGISTEDVIERINDRTKGIIIVHYGGQALERKYLMEIAEEKDIKVIEDAAHSLGAKFTDGRFVGSSGHCSFSFYPNKNITTGHGGMVTTHDDVVAEKVKILRNQGVSLSAWERGTAGYDVLDAGYSFLMNDIAAAMGYEQIKKIERLNRRRKEIAEIYDEEFEDLPLILPRFGEGSVYYIYPIQLLEGNRDKFREELMRRGVQTSIHYIPLHMTSYYSRYATGKYPVAEKVYRRIVSLPIYSCMSDEEVLYVVSSVKEAIKCS